MKRIIIKILLRMLGRPYYKPLSIAEVDSLLTRLAKDDEYKSFPAFLQQCADAYRNQYLYSGNIMFRGAVLAFTSLREQILAKKGPRKKKILTNESESGKIKVPY